MKRTIVLSLILAVVALPSLATAQEPDKAVVDVVTDFIPPSWASPPAQMEEYPDFAAAIELNGNVRINCVAKLSHQLGDCRIVEAVPRGLGFEAIALQGVRNYRITPAQTSRGPVERRVEFTIQFSLEDYKLKKIWMGPKPTPLQVSSSARVAHFLFEDEEFDTPVTFDLSELDDDVRLKVSAILAAHPFPDPDGEAIIATMSQAMGYALANRGYRAFPETRPKDWDLLISDFMAVWGVLQAEETEAFNQLTQRIKAEFCAVHDCGEIN